MTFNEKLKQALAEEHDERMKKYALSEEKHRFSLAYRLWERKLLRDIRKNRFDTGWTLHKARRVAMTGLIAAAVFTLASCAAATVFVTGRFSFDDKREYSKLFLESISSDKTRIEEYYGLSAEDGWTIDYLYIDEHSTNIVYTYGEKSVSFMQDIIRGDMGNVNTENAHVEPMSVFEKNDGFFIAFHDGNCGLWWIYDGYLLSATGNLNKNELENLAHSTKIVNFQKSCCN